MPTPQAAATVITGDLSMVAAHVLRVISGDESRQCPASSGRGEEVEYGEWFPMYRWSITQAAMKIVICEYHGIGCYLLTCRGSVDLVKPQEPVYETIAMLEEEWDEMNYQRLPWPCSGYSIDLLSIWYDGSYPHHEWMMADDSGKPESIELRLWFDKRRRY